MSLEELKKLQEELILKNKRINITFLVLGILLTIIAISINLIAAFFVLVFTLIIANIIKSIVLGKEIVIFNQNFKKLFVVDALQNTFDNLIYNANGGIDENTLIETGLINTGDRYSSNDYIKATFKTIGFEQSDICIEERHEEVDKDGNKEVEWEDIFFGRWLIFDFNKKFKYNLQIVSKRFDGRVLRRVGQRVILEDMEFNKQFMVLAENDHEAFYILTPSFMEKLKNLLNAIDGSIMFCFVDNKLHVAINNNKDSFEYNVFKKIDEEKIEKEIMKDINLITNLVEELELDNNLFKEGV